MFKHLVDANFPRLAAHLDRLGAHVAGVSTQWWVTFQGRSRCKIEYCRSSLDIGGRVDSGICSELCRGKTSMEQTSEMHAENSPRT